MRALAAVGFTHGMFNVELRVCAAAASFVMRDLAGAGLGRWPRRGEIAALRARHPLARTMFYLKRGADPRRVMKWLGSYRYGVVNLGAGSADAALGEATAD